MTRHPFQVRSPIDESLPLISLYAFQKDEARWRDARGNSFFFRSPLPSRSLSQIFLRKPLRDLLGFCCELTPLATSDRPERVDPRCTEGHPKILSTPPSSHRGKKKVFLYSSKAQNDRLPVVSQSTYSFHTRVMSLLPSETLLAPLS